MWRGKKQTDRDAATLTSVTLGSPGKNKGQRVQTTEANEGQVDMWSSNKQQQSNTHSRGWWKRSRGEEAKQASSRGRPMQNADWTGLDWIGLDRLMNARSLLMAAQWPPVAGRGPDSVRLSSTPLVEPRIGIRVVGIIRPSPWIALSRTGVKSGQMGGQVRAGGSLLLGQGQTNGGGER